LSEEPLILRGEKISKLPVIIFLRCHSLC